MADDSVLLNSGDAPFVEREVDLGEANVYPGNFVQIDSDGDATKNTSEGDTGEGLIVGLGFDPDVERGTAYASGERVRAYHVPIGGQVRARLAPGADITTASEPDIAEGDLLVETLDGGLAQADSNTIGSPQGPVYRALEAADNSGGSSGVANQIAIEVERVA